MAVRVLAGAAIAAIGAAAPARAQFADNTIKIGVLNDMSGPFADVSGKGSVVAAQMAADDFAKEAGPGAPKVRDPRRRPPEQGRCRRRHGTQWVDQDGVVAVADVPNSAVALAVNQVMKEKDRTFLASSSATSDLTGPQCTPTTVQWTFDTWALANGTARALVEQGGRTWFFLASDYALGAAIVRDTSGCVKQAGGSVLGERPHAARRPPTCRRTCCRRSRPGAQVIGIAAAGDDVTNTVKQACRVRHRPRRHAAAGGHAGVPDRRDARWGCRRRRACC